MATGNSVHDEVKEQQQKLKGKPFKEKWAYFWEYYKIQTIVVIAVLAFAGNLIYTFATRKDTVMEAAFVNCYMNTEVDSDPILSSMLTSIPPATVPQSAGICMWIMKTPINTPMQIYRKLSR